jgi:hypothetical protein
MAARSSPAHSGTGAGSATESRPRSWAMPTSRWHTLLACDQECSAVSGVIGPGSIPASSASGCSSFMP